MAEPMDDRELERLMKEGLEQRASTVDESAAGRLVASAREGSSRNPWRTTAVMGLAAASVAGIAFATVALNDDDIRSGGRGPATDGPATGTSVTDWRTEYWHDTKVDVPADWGWGGAPLPDSVSREDGGEGRLLDCGAAAFVGANGARFLNSDPSVPYVGRPMYMTDVCSVRGSSDGRPDAPPSAPYVWLGVRIEPGTVDVGDGYTQETIEVNGSTVTVATKDAALRRQILDSATGGETCMSEYDDAPTIEAVSREGIADPVGITVCAYQREGEDGPANLVYATQVGAEAARAFEAAIRRNPAAANPYCIGDPTSEWVLLTVEGSDGTRADNLVHLDRCPGIELTPGEGPIELNEETVSPWAVDGIPAYVIGPYGGKGLTGGFFKGMLG